MLLFVLNLASFGSCLQSWVEQPRYQEVNPGGDVILPCRVRDLRGECRWEVSTRPVGIFPGKYEWAAPEGPETLALASLCHVLMISNEFLYID